MSISKKEILLSDLKADIDSILNDSFIDLDKATDKIYSYCRQLNLLKQTDLSTKELKEKSLDIYRSAVADLCIITTALEHRREEFKQKVYSRIVCSKTEEISCYNKNIFLNVGRGINIMMKDIKLFIKTLIMDLDVYIMNNVHNTEINDKEFTQRITEFVENTNYRIRTFKLFIRSNFNRITVEMRMIK